MSTKTQNAPGAKAPLNAGTPNQTLYLRNLPEKLNKTELKRALYMLFTTYGPVLDVVTNRVGAKSQSMRGQAHVVYRDIQTSTQAMRALQGFEFFGKEMVIAYGKGQSSIIPKLRGTFEPPVTGASGAETTALQKSIFNAPPSGITSVPSENGVKPSEVNGVPHGTKRTREEEEEEEEDDAPMEEDEDDAPMEEDED
ncbi:hypothetical protein LTR72_010164 [Exophiala xenobiotica]|nr:hypothetical protein LTR41_009696 [Exophiala xenobiotica]KAK5216794.1 hypothetical protein LTR72_010164 [Exophiala xenobiotica]KAK5286856.1 hypothetical protein LTR14_009601 [Exophiala xenobiotica]KAK5318219.1 hypothetical protein LTR93_008265 [Exophiala xenobiotica]KAK5478061.1 hypothetical protein LTR55_008045 [Exophiala xenobiotica]